MQQGFVARRNFDACWCMDRLAGEDSTSSRGQQNTGWPADRAGAGLLHDCYCQARHVRKLVKPDTDNNENTPVGIANFEPDGAGWEGLFAELHSDTGVLGADGNGGHPAQAYQIRGIQVKRKHEIQAFVFGHLEGVNLEENTGSTDIGRGASGCRAPGVQQINAHIDRFTR
jgi:hypothetical protein